MGRYVDDWYTNPHHTTTTSKGAHNLRRHRLVQNWKGCQTGMNCIPTPLQHLLWMRHARCVTNLWYADDVVLIAGTMEELQHLVDRVKTSSEKVGLSLNVKKTKVTKVLNGDYPTWAMYWVCNKRWSWVWWTERWKEGDQRCDTWTTSKKKAVYRLLRHTELRKTKIAGES